MLFAFPRNSMKRFNCPLRENGIIIDLVITHQTSAKAQRGVLNFSFDQISRENSWAYPHYIHILPPSSPFPFLYFPLVTLKSYVDCSLFAIYFMLRLLCLPFFFSLMLLLFFNLMTYGKLFVTFIRGICKYCYYMQIRFRYENGI